MDQDKLEIPLKGYCYRINQDVEVLLIKRKVRDELTLEEVIQKEIGCTKAEICGLAPESCQIVWEIINRYRGKK